MFGEAPQPISMQRYDPTVSYEGVGAPEKFAEKDEPVVCGVVPIMTAGYLVCSVVMAEGLFLLLDMGADVSGANVGVVGMDAQNPYHHAQRIVLIVVGFVDVFMALAAAVGLWIAGGAPLEALGDRLQGNLPAFGIGILLAWRIATTVAIAPWLGFLMAFEPAEYARGQCLLVALAYIALNVYMLWVLSVTHKEVAQRGAYLQQLLASVQAERFLLVGRARATPGGDELVRHPKLLGCVPLELAIAAYALAVCVACTWSFIALCIYGSARGGWAVLTGSVVHHPGGAFWLEAVVYSVPAVLGGLAVSAILTHPQLSQEETGSRARCSFLILLFLIGSIARYAAFIPITAMQLADSDICGLYTYGLSRVASHAAENPLWSTTRCSEHEVVALVAVVLALVLDAYLISGVFRLWQAYHEGQLFAADSAARVKVNGYGDYGASS